MISEKEFLEGWIQWLKIVDSSGKEKMLMSAANLIGHFEARLTAISPPQVMEPHLFATPRLRFVKRFEMTVKNGVETRRVLQQLYSPLGTDAWKDCEWRDVPLDENP